MSYISLHALYRGFENFGRKVGPLLYAAKGLAGTREIPPSLITQPLVQIVQAYLSFNPLSKEHLRIMDLGCGTGALSRRIFTKAFDNVPTDEELNIYALLNDDSQTNPGKHFRLLSLEEVYAGAIDSRFWKGDMRRLISDLHDLDERFDIAFMNRVLDMYGGYGIFEFEFEPKREDGSCSSFTKRMQPQEPNVGDVLAFTESTCHEDVWRAIKYIFERQPRRKRDGLYLVPCIDMKMMKNFFAFDGSDIFRRLLAISELVVVSVFPGDFKALFPDVNSAKDNIFCCERTSETSYSIMCISASKDLIESIGASCSDFRTC